MSENSKSIEELLNKYADKDDAETNAAEAFADEDDFVEEQQPKKSGSFLVAASVFVLAAAAGAGGYMYLNKQKADVNALLAPAAEPIVQPAEMATPVEMPVQEQVVAVEGGAPQMVDGQMAATEPQAVPAPVIEGVPQDQAVVALPNAAGAETPAADPFATLTQQVAAVPTAEAPAQQGVVLQEAPAAQPETTQTSAAPAVAAVAATAAAAAIAPAAAPTTDTKTAAEVVDLKADQKPVALVEEKPATTVQKTIEKVETVTEVQEVAELNAQPVKAAVVRAKASDSFADPMDEAWSPAKNGGARTALVAPAKQSAAFVPAPLAMAAAPVAVAAPEARLNYSDPLQFAGDQAYRMGQYERASTLFGQALAANPNNAAIIDAKNKADAKLGRAATPAPVAPAATPVMAAPVEAVAKTAVAAPVVVPAAKTTVDVVLPKGAPVTADQVLGKAVPATTAPVPAPAPTPPVAPKPASPVVVKAETPAVNVNPSATPAPAAPATPAPRVTTELVVPSNIPASARNALGTKGEVKPVAAPAPVIAPKQPVVAPVAAVPAPAKAVTTTTTATTTTTTTTAKINPPVATPTENKLLDMVMSAGSGTDGVTDAKTVLGKAQTADKAGKVGEAIALYQKALEVDAVQGGGKSIDRGAVYDALARLRTTPQ